MKHVCSYRYVAIDAVQGVASVCRCSYMYGKALAILFDFSLLK